MPASAVPVSVVIVMGVSGAGKTTLGRALAGRLAALTGRSWTFRDADDFHSAEALRKMGRGESLTDADRAPWLARLASLIQEHARGGPGLVLACSALKAAYRETLAAGSGRVATVWLDAPRGVLAARLASRLGDGAQPKAGVANPVGPSLLPSQLATLEPPAEALRLDATRSVEALVMDAAAAVVGADGT